MDDCTKHGRNGWGNHDDDAYGGKHLGGLYTHITVANHCGHNDSGHACSQALQHAHADEPFHLMHLCDDNRSQNKNAQPDQANGFSTFQIGQRAANELPHSSPQQIGTEAFFHQMHAAAQIFGHIRHGRQIGIDRKWHDGHQHGQQKRQLLIT